MPAKEQAVRPGGSDAAVTAAAGRDRVGRLAVLGKSKAAPLSRGQRATHETLECKQQIPHQHIENLAAIMSWRFISPLWPLAAV